MKTTELAALDALDLSKVDVRDAKHFRAIVAANKSVSAAQDELRTAVLDARTAGDSWTVIGAALGITKQAAQQRFSR